MNHLGRLALLGAAMLATLAGPVPSARAQEPTKRVGPPMEIYPPHISAALEQHRSGLLPGSIGNAIEMQGVYNRSKLWQSAQVLRACFFEGPSLDTLSRIVRTAKQWEKAGNIKLDFGDLNNPRMCRTNQANEIRIGYAYKGYWSLVGQDSVNFSRQYDQSMNLEFFNSLPPVEPEFSSTVLHEFGHAVGLQHEHQNPKSTCEQEFNWDAIYASLAAPPNGWDKAKVDLNMRRLLNDGDVNVVGEFDKRSIMLYTFPDWMYRDGTGSSCYFTANAEISDGDRATVAYMYPTDPAVAQARRLTDAKLLQEKLSSVNLVPAARDRALQNLELLNSSKPIQSRLDALQLLNAPAAQ